MSKIYKLTLKQNSGLLTKLQSDTIFGHFCWRLKDRLGEEKLSLFLDSYKNKSPIFTISNGFLQKNGEIFFPKPLFQIEKSQAANSKKEKIRQFLANKEAKQRTSITLNELNLFLDGKKDEYLSSLIKPIGAPKILSDLKIGVEIDRSTLRSKEGALYNLKPEFIEKETEYAVFIKVIDDKLFADFECKEILEDVFNIGFGKKKSAGYGEFSNIKFELFEKFKESENSTGFISLSNYLPSNDDDLIEAYYNLNLKYGKLGEEKSNSSNPFKKPILLSEPGSCFFTKKNKEYYGRITKEGEISDSFSQALQNGFSFSLKFNYPNEGKV